MSEILEIGTHAFFKDIPINNSAQRFVLRIISGDEKRRGYLYLKIDNRQAVPICLDTPSEIEKQDLSEKGYNALFPLVNLVFFPETTRVKIVKRFRKEEYEEKPHLTVVK